MQWNLVLNLRRLTMWRAAVRHVWIAQIIHHTNDYESIQTLSMLTLGRYRWDAIGRRSCLHYIKSLAAENSERFACGSVDQFLIMSSWKFDDVRGRLRNFLCLTLNSKCFSSILIATPTAAKLWPWKMFWVAAIKLARWNCFANMDKKKTHEMTSASIKLVLEFWQLWLLFFFLESGKLLRFFVEVCQA